MLKIKLCGFTEKNSLQTAIEENCDFLGFVFCEKSPRFITPKNAGILAAVVPSFIKKVAVVVDPTVEFLEEINAKLSPDFFQFHGSETIDFLKISRQKFPHVKIIKAFKITTAADLSQIKNFENYADFFILDSANPGAGKKFDWKILQNFSCNKPWFLAGGLNSDNIEEAISISGAKLVDISSGIERIRGEKSPELIKNFMAKARNYAAKN